jgi:hypothetical protein
MLLVHGRLVRASMLLAAVALASSACSTDGLDSPGAQSEAGDDDGGANDAGGDGPETTTFSCAMSIVCVEVVAPVSRMAAEQAACATEMGTFGAACPRAGSFGCCAQGNDTQCYYTASEVMIGKALCGGAGMTWSMANDQ